MSETTNEETTARLEQLEEERQRLAPATLTGDKKALKRVEEIEGEIGRINRLSELERLAEQERERLEEEDRRRAEEEAHREAVSRYDELVGKRPELLGNVEKALDALDKAATRLLEHHEEQREVGVSLGIPFGYATSYLLRDRLLSRLGHLLSGVPGTASGEHKPLPEADTYLQTITEMKAGAEEAGTRAGEQGVEAEEAQRLADQMDAARIAAWTIVSPAVTATGPGNLTNSDYRREVHERALMSVRASAPDLSDVEVGKVVEDAMKQGFGQPALLPATAPSYWSQTDRMEG